MKTYSNVHIKDSISIRLLMYVCSIYFLLAVLATITHMVIEYRYTQNQIFQEIINIKHSFEPGLAKALWEEDREVLTAIFRGMDGMPSITGALVIDEREKTAAVSENANHLKEYPIISHKDLDQLDYVFFGRQGISWPLYYQEKGQTFLLGRLILFIDSEIIFNRVELGFLFIMVNATLKAIALWIVFLIISRKLLIRPLTELVAATRNIAYENLSSFKVRIHSHANSELKSLETSFNQMIETLHTSFHEQLQIKSLLAEEREWFSSTLSSIGDGVIATDSQGKITLMNPVAETLTGCSFTKAQHQRIDTIAHFEDLEEEEGFLELVHMLEYENCILYREFIFKILHQHTFYFISGNVSPIQDKENNLHGYVWVFRDVTEKRKMRQQLQRADQLKDEFLANTSHELRTPLHGIIGICETMQSSSHQSLSQEQQTHLQLIIHSARRLMNLVNDLLDISKIRSQELQLQLKSVDMLSNLSLAKQLCLPLIAEKPLDLVIDAPSPPVWVHADEERLQQIMLNLLSNAIKFTREGIIRIAIEKFEGYVRFEIADTGIGISEEQQRQIFQPFRQADGSTSRQYGGTGLGLAITQQLVSLHGGELNVNSQLGKGSLFSFTLPTAALQKMQTLPDNHEWVAQKQIEQKEVQNSLRYIPLAPISSQLLHTSSTTGTPSKTLEPADPYASILVVDDDSINRELLQKQLEHENYLVQSAADGSQALQAIAQQRPDLILMDLMMPYLNGFEACQKIRQNYSAVELPIIILTARTQKEDLVQSLAVGANDYLTKPFQKEEMLARIHTQLEQKHAAIVLKENARLQKDIEHFQQIESELRQSGKDFLQILDHTTEAVLAINTEGAVVYGNTAAAMILGYAQEELHLISVQDLIGETPEKHPLEEILQEETSPSLFEKQNIITSFSRKIGTSIQVNFSGNWLELKDSLLLISFSEHFPAQKSISTHPTNLQQLIAAVPKAPSSSSLPEAITRLTSYAVHCWEVFTHKTMVELAEESELWTVTPDDSRVRARNFERYLSLKNLPKRPRWRLVVQTTHFVLKYCPPDSPEKAQLEDYLQDLLSLLRTHF